MQFTCEKSKREWREKIRARQSLADEFLVLIIAVSSRLRLHLVNLDVICAKLVSLASEKRIVIHQESREFNHRARFACARISSQDLLRGKVQ